MAQLTRPCTNSSVIQLSSNHPKVTRLETGNKMLCIGDDESDQRQDIGFSLPVRWTSAAVSMLAFIATASTISLTQAPATL